MKDLITLVQQYAAVCASAERHHALAECLVDDADGQVAATAAEFDSVATVRHAQLLTALDKLTRTTVQALPDQRLPVCTRQRGTVEVRAIASDGGRCVHVRYIPAQAIAAGTALIACAAVADNDTGGSLTPILPAFPDPTPADASTGAGDPAKQRSRS